MATRPPDKLGVSSGNWDSFRPEDLHAPLNGGKGYDCHDTFSSAFSSQPKLDLWISTIKEGFEKVVTWILSHIPFFNYTPAREEHTPATSERESAPIIWNNAEVLREVIEGSTPLETLQGLLEKALEAPDVYTEAEVQQVFTAFIDRKLEGFPEIARFIWICSSERLPESESHVAFSRRYLESEGCFCNQWRIFLHAAESSRLTPLTVFVSDEEELVTAKCSALKREFFDVDVTDPRVQRRVEKGLRVVVHRLARQEQNRPFLTRIAEWMRKLDTNGEREKLPFPIGEEEPWVDLVTYVRNNGYDLGLFKAALGHLFFEEVFRVFNRPEETVATKLHYLQVAIQEAEPHLIPVIFRHFQYLISPDRRVHPVEQNTDIYEELIAKLFAHDVSQDVHFFKEHPEGLVRQKEYFEGVLVSLMEAQDVQVRQFSGLVVSSIVPTLQAVTEKREAARRLAEEERVRREAELLRLQQEREEQAARELVEQQRLEAEREARQIKQADRLTVSNPSAEEPAKLAALDRALKSGDQAHAKNVLSAFLKHNVTLLKERYPAEIMNPVIWRAIYELEESWDETGATLYAELEALAKSDKDFGHPHHLKSLGLARFKLNWDYYTSIDFLSYADTSKWNEQVQEAMKNALKAQIQAGKNVDKFLIAGFKR